MDFGRNVSLTQLTVFTTAPIVAGRFYGFAINGFLARDTQTDARNRIAACVWNVCATLDAVSK
jgi:hypothetical protein